MSYAKELMHGKQKEIHPIGENQLFQGLPETFPAARYHSLAALKEKLPEELKACMEAYHVKPTLADLLTEKEEP